MLALFGRSGGGSSDEVEVAGPPPAVRVRGGSAAEPFVTITRRDGREWVLTMSEVDGLIWHLTEAKKAYRREVGRWHE
jgi:hypothetical protein